MKYFVITILLLLNHYSYANVITIGSGFDCDHHDLQLAINDSLVNNQNSNELRIVNDASFNQQSYIIDFVEEQTLSLVGGYQNCEDASNNHISGKTVFDAQDTTTTQALFTIREHINGLGLFSFVSVSFDNIVLKNSQAQNGAAININNIQTTLTNVDLLNNQAENGGAIYCSGDRSYRLNLLGTEIKNNSVSNNGGALYIAGDEDFPKGCQIILTSENRQNIFENNHADNNGGAIFIDTYVEAETIFAFQATNSPFLSAVFLNNNAIDGGAVFHSDGLVIFNDINFDNNQATNKGGAIYSEKFSNTFLFPAITLSGNLYNNHASISGGAIYSEKVHYSLSAINAVNNSSPRGAFADILGSELYIASSRNIFSGHQDSQSLFNIESTNTTLAKLHLINTIIKNNNNLENIIEATKGRVWLSRSYVFQNQVNDALFKKTNFTNSFHDMFFFNTIADNTVGNAVFSYEDNTYQFLNNIIWQPNQVIFDITNSTGLNNCNILSSEIAAHNGTNNMTINPLFVNALVGDYRTKTASPAVDYCAYDNHPVFGFNDQDFDDILFSDNLFGLVDIGADVKSAFDYIFLDSFE